MSTLSIGIVGLPNVGKSTLFNALTGSNILAANYPFATIEPNTGIVPVPDPRLTKLAEIYKTSKIIPATVTFVDIAGLVAGASKGEGLGNQFLSHIRSCNAIVQVVRAFDDPNVLHVDDEASAARSTAARGPARDIDVINTELVLADLQTVDKRLQKFEKEARANPKLMPILQTLQQVRALLDSGTPIWNTPDTSGVNATAQATDTPAAAAINREHIADLQLITAKKVIYLFNMDEAGLSDSAKQAHLQQLVTPATALFVCAKLESELKELDAGDAAELLESYGQHESGLIQLIHAAYATLGLQSYLTAGAPEVRAWTIPAGATAPQAAGVIHGDFERGFIAADIVSYPDLVQAAASNPANPLAAAKSAGKLRTEGKTYRMQTDDIVEFKFNVSK